MTEPSGWTHGYPVNEPYPSSWHSFQSPAHLRAICAIMGVAWEVGPDTALSVAELGCGTGYTAHMLAAGNPHWRVLGLDYNPAHIAEARSMAAAAQLDNLRFVEADLAELAPTELDALPEFDLTTVHGVWSWVADPVRQGVLRLLQRRLKPGGLVLMTYNALPGAANGLGMARLVRGSMLQAGNSVDGQTRAAALVQRLVAAEATHMVNSGWRRMLTGEIKDVRPGYLMHEFQTEHWRPSFHADIAAAMATVRCDYVGSATIDENFPQMSLTPAQRELWDEAPDAATQQLIFDLCVQRPFRRDLYVRGARHVARDAAIDSLWLAGTTHAEGEAILRAQAGEAKLPKLMVDAARAALLEAPHTVAALRALPGCASATPAELLALLVGSGCAAPMWRQPGSGADWPQAVAAARRFNAVAAQRLAPYGVGAGQLGLATPVLGGGVRVSPLELGFARVLAADPTLTDPAALARALLPPGTPPGPEVLAELERAAAALLRNALPVWRAFGIV